MKKLNFFVFLFCSLFGFAGNETSGRITGKIIDRELNEPIPYATIIISGPAEKFISGSTSDNDGSFVIEKIAPGEYTLKVQFIGYKTFSEQISISADNSKLDLGIIYLEPELSQLDDITINTERSTIEQRIDRKVINIGKDLTTLGPSASDIMGNLPTLTVDQDGNIAMRGNDNVRILVDGKPTNIPASQLLKQIPSTSIKSVELITNPSAKYNPEGMSGIINIVLHKNTNLGFNGNLNTGVTIGKNTRYNGSLNMNYRNGKFNFFGSLGSNFGKRENNALIANLTNDSRQVVHLLNDGFSFLSKVGVDYYMNDKNTFSFYTIQNRFDGETFGNTDIIYQNNDIADIFQNFINDRENTSSTYNGIYKRNFEKENHTLELEIDYNVVDEMEHQKYEITGGAGAFQNYTDDSDNQSESTTLNLDYVNPLTKDSKMELGAEARLRNSINDYSTTNTNINDARFNYDNTIYSLYATYGQNFDKWSYQLGARLEQYEVEALYNGGRIFEDDYITVYPTAFTTYKLSEKRSLQLSFGRRVDRPSLGQVNPIRDFSTPRMTITGNPELNPQFTNSLEFNYTHNYNKGSLTAGTFYRLINNEINRTLLEDPEDPARLLMTFTNGEDNSAYGAEFSGSYKPYKWWNINSSFEIYYRNLRGVIGNEYVEVDNTAYNLRLSQSFNATKKLTFQVFGIYRSPAQMLQIKTKEIFFVNSGARYSFLQNAASVSLNVSDVFNTQRFRFVTELPYHQRARFKGETRSVYLGFAYRFGGGKNSALKRKNRDTNEADDGSLF